VRPRYPVSHSSPRDPSLLHSGTRAGDTTPLDSAVVGGLRTPRGLLRSPHGHRSRSGRMPAGPVVPESRGASYRRERLGLSHGSASPHTSAHAVIGALDCRASPLARPRAPLPAGEEFLFFVKAAGFAGGPAAAVGRAAWRPVPPDAAALSVSRATNAPRHAVRELVRISSAGEGRGGRVLAAVSPSCHRPATTALHTRVGKGRTRIAAGHLRAEQLAVTAQTRLVTYSQGRHGVTKSNQMGLPCLSPTAWSISVDACAHCLFEPLR